MAELIETILKSNLDETNYTKLAALKNSALHAFVAEAIELCGPMLVFVASDSAEDVASIREMALRKGDERPLAMAGHTVHFDGPQDQGRDKERTAYLVPAGMKQGRNLKAVEREQGLAEVKGLLAGSMAGRTMIVRFFNLGPAHSPFSIRGVQVTDSYYVAHSEDLLYRPGYEQFKSIGDSPDFFRVMHSAGRLENHVSAEPDKRRIYIDLTRDTVYSVNTQYAGNTVGFKKLSLRLAIHKADREAWLAEHMFVMGVHGPKDRTTYFAGAFPSACGKTSTAMMEGETILGDDLAYLRIIDGDICAVNVECGIFGIIRDVNPKDDPVIWRQITTPGEVIFSNVLIEDGKPYWAGMGQDTPESGINYVGEWRRGITDADGREILAAHPNSRYTIRLAGLANLDPRVEDPQGVPLGAIIYGGRDSDTWVPVQQAFDWMHGVLTMGACLESETTAATLGKTGVRSFQPMSNLDFISILLGKYIQNHLDFGARASKKPVIFATNYFMKGADGQYLTGMNDKRVWIKWAELRVHGDVPALKGPTGWLPHYEDLKRLFENVLGAEYTEAQYEEQFKIRIPENLAKISRMRNIWGAIPDKPKALTDALDVQEQRLNALRAKHGDYVSPKALG